MPSDQAHNLLKDGLSRLSGLNLIGQVFTGC